VAKKEATTNDSASVDTVVQYGEREFILEEPSAGVVLRILNVIGAVAMRAETAAERVMKEPTNRAVLFGLLAVLSEDDLIRLGSAVLQFEDDRDGRKWLKSKGVLVAPLVKALFINLRLSKDLMEALRNFFGGVEAVMGVVEAIAPPEIPILRAATEEETEDTG
jgi:hypothetical protein